MNSEEVESKQEEADSNQDESELNQEEGGCYTSSEEGPSPPSSRQDFADAEDSAMEESLMGAVVRCVETMKGYRHVRELSVAAKPLSVSDQMIWDYVSDSDEDYDSDVELIFDEEQASTPSEASKLSSVQKPLFSQSCSKSLLVNTSSVSSAPSPVCTPSTSKDSLQNHSSSSHSNTFIQQVRHKKQGVPPPDGGFKLSTTNLSTSSSLPFMSKQDSIFSKKSPSVFPAFSPPVIENSLSNSSSSSGELSNSQNFNRTTQTTESQSNVQSTSSSKNPSSNATARNPQFTTRSIFSNSSTNVVRAKSQSPVIYSMSTATNTVTQSSVSKTNTTIQSEVTKTTPQILPKSVTSTGVKLNATSASSFQYRNDGGVMRSARILNISQPVGTRLPCAISPSAMTALGLSGQLPTNALRVTLPAGTLSSPSSIRMSAASKPNVIVVHKAQVWPRTTQGGGVVVGSTPLVPKLTNDVSQEAVSSTPKQDKSKPSGLKPSSKTIVRPQPPAVPFASEKAPENKAASKPSQSDSTASEAYNSKSPENPVDPQGKKSLLADIMEASGILLENTARSKAVKEKSNAVKSNQDMCDNDEIEIIGQKIINLPRPASAAKFSKFSETIVSKIDSEKQSSGSTALTVKSVERNGIVEKPSSTQTTQAQSIESQSKEMNSLVVSLHLLNELDASRSECNSKEQQNVTNDEDS